MKKKKGPEIEVIGFYVSAALGLLEEGESVQPNLFDLDIREDVLRYECAISKRRLRRVLADPARRARHYEYVRKWRIQRGRTEEHGDFSEEQWEALKREFGYRCAYCGRRAPLQIEHVIPVVQGGKHTKSNIVPSCKHCNCTKGGRTPEQAGLTIRERNK